jgi:hypothetical protein
MGLRYVQGGVDVGVGNNTHLDVLVVLRIRSRNHAGSSPEQSPARTHSRHKADPALAPRYRTMLQRRLACVCP